MFFMFYWLAKTSKTSTKKKKIFFCQFWKKMIYSLNLKFILNNRLSSIDFKKKF